MTELTDVMKWADAIVEKRPFHPEKNAVKCYRFDEAVVSVVFCDHLKTEFEKMEELLGKPRPKFRMNCDWFCGYVRFRSPMLAGQIDDFVPVHGGITYNSGDEDGSQVYGFDCNHCYDQPFDKDYDPRVRDPEWVASEAERLALGITVAARFEPSYIGETDKQKRIAVLEKYHAEMAKLGAKFSLGDNFGATIRAMFGDV